MGAWSAVRAGGFGAGWCRVVLPCLALVCALMFSGCGSFFQPNSSGTGSGSGTGTGSGSGSGTGLLALDSVYVANSNPSLDTVAAYSLTGAGVLNNLAGSPSVLPETPTAFAINPAGTLLWVGSQLGAIYVYVINTDGSLSLGNSQQPVQPVAASSLLVDPSGQWLLALSNTSSGLSSTTNPTVSVFQIDSSNGTLTPSGNALPLDPGTSFQLAFAPNGIQLYAALGTGGVDGLSFSPQSGVLSKLSVYLAPTTSGGAAQGLAIDPQGKYLFVAETALNGVAVYSIGSNGVLTAAPGSPYPDSPDANHPNYGAKSVLVDKTGAYVYVSNSSTNTISGYTLASSTGTLTAMAGSPFVTGTSPYSLAQDSSGAFLVAACIGGTPDLQVFGIAAATAATPGALTSVGTASTGSVSPAGAIAVATTP